MLPDRTIMIKKEKNADSGKKDFNLEEEIRTIVRLAESYIAKGLMTEPQALKYLNLTKTVFDKYRTTTTL